MQVKRILNPFHGFHMLLQFCFFKCSNKYATTLLWAAVPPRQSVVDGLRTIALKLEFGVSHNQTFERYCYSPSLFLHISSSYCRLIFLGPSLIRINVQDPSCAFY